jgi:hypothetical protein
VLWYARGGVAALLLLRGGVRLCERSPAEEREKTGSAAPARSCVPFNRSCDQLSISVLYGSGEGLLLPASTVTAKKWAKTNPVFSLLENALPV